MAVDSRRTDFFEHLWVDTIVNLGETETELVFRCTEQHLAPQLGRITVGIARPSLLLIKAGLKP